MLWHGACISGFRAKLWHRRCIDSFVHVSAHVWLDYIVLQRSDRLLDPLGGKLGVYPVYANVF